MDVKIDSLLNFPDFGITNMVTWHFWVLLN